jgi:hypothetical protein
MPAAVKAVNCVLPPTPRNTMLRDREAPYTMHENIQPKKFPTAWNKKIVLF